MIPGAYHASIGQEAAIVGACLALRDEDAMTGTHRSHGHPIGKGAELNPLMAELMGKETGVCKGRGGSMHLADKKVGIISESAIVGGGIPLATGCALAAKVRKIDQVTLCFFGDGAVNQGTFHESLNMGGLWKLPVVYFCENNGYAIVTSLKLTHGQHDISRRADSYGIPGVSVDGQDVEAVYEATQTAVARARRGDGPTLIEAKTYRFDYTMWYLLFPHDIAPFVSRGAYESAIPLPCTVLRFWLPHSPRWTLRRSKRSTVWRRQAIQLEPARCPMYRVVRSSLQQSDPGVLRLCLFQSQASRPRRMFE